MIGMAQTSPEEYLKLAVIWFSAHAFQALHTFLGGRPGPRFKLPGVDRPLVAAAGVPPFFMLASYTTHVTSWSPYKSWHMHLYAW